MPFARRNGTVPSCEPCRKAKVRCNHESPCYRCLRRGRADACIYHPAPLSRPASGLADDTISQVTEINAANEKGHQWREPISLQAHADTNERLVLTQDASPHPLNGSANDVNLKEIEAAITQLYDNFSLVERVYRALCISSVKCLVPAKFSIALLDSISQLFRTHSINNGKKAKNGVRAAAKRILESTAADLLLDHSASPESFISSWCDDNLRAQSLGLVCNHAARAALVDHEHNHKKFVQSMLLCSSRCLSIARDIAPQMDDILLWLGHDNLYLLMAVKGDRDPVVWPRLGLLSSDLYALGLHRENTLQLNAPRFLIELRRKAFASTYHLDAVVCTYFDNPPRVLRKYADTKPPLDLLDSALLGTESELDAAVAGLSQDGWSSSDTYCSSTWARMRYFLGIVKEEVAHFSYVPHPLSSEDIDKIRNLSIRNHQIWHSFPVRLRFTAESWPAGLNSAVCDMLIIAYLQYLHLDLQIHRLLEQYDASSSLTVLKTAADMVATVVQLGNVRDRPVPLSYVTWNWGVPSVAILTSAVIHFIRTARPFPEGYSKPKIVRNLSVFASYLENMFQPENANHKIANQVSDTIVRTLEDILDDNVEKRTQAPAAIAAQKPLEGNGVVEIVSYTDGDAEMADPSNWAYDELDLNDWMTNIDWATVTNNEWSYV